MHQTALRSWVCSDRAALAGIAGMLLDTVGSGRVFAFYGELGAGKTTLIQELCRILHVRQNVTSPTFNLLNEYITDEGSPVYHFDFYRIGSISEAFDLGYEDYFFSGNYCFIEWPGRIESLLPDDCIRITIEQTGEGRNITMHL